MKSGHDHKQQTSKIGGQPYRTLTYFVTLYAVSECSLAKPSQS